MPQRCPTYTSTLHIYEKCDMNHFLNEGVSSWFDFAKMIQQIVVEFESSETDKTFWNSRSLRSAALLFEEFLSQVKRLAYSILDKTQVKHTF